MNEAKDSGGPVFPVQNGLHNGMHLRDYFAAKALQGIISATPEKMPMPPSDATAERAYKYADAMIKARK
jgi:hypothetical protein